jgi:hypothetical protein
VRLPGKSRWQRRLAALDPETDYEEMSRIQATLEFPWDVTQALSFALFRTYAVPSIGRLLHETGQFTTATQKRHDDTVLILEEISLEGMESSGGRAAIRRMNQMHGRYGIGNDDMLYVLSTFVVTPVRWIERYGWRQGTQAERTATVRYYQRLGRLMGIHDVPATYDDFARLMDAYEAEHVRYDWRSREVADATLELLTTFYPRPARRLVRASSIALLDPPLRDAFGYDHPPAWFERAAHGALRLRGRVVALLPARRQPRLNRDLARVRSYPGGFLVERLGTFAPEDERVVAGAARGEPVTSATIR